MSRKSYWMIVTAAILCLAMAMVGCSPEEEAGVLKIGNVGPLTGGAANYGINVLRGIEVAVDEANASGELGDLTLKVYSEDTGGDWSKAANAFSKLIDVDKVDVIIGGVLSSESEAGGPIAKDAA